MKFYEIHIKKAIIDELSGGEHRGDSPRADIHLTIKCAKYLCDGVKNITITPSK